MFFSKLRGFCLFLFHLISEHYLEAVPVSTAQTEHVPWAQPCMPNMRGLRTVSVQQMSTISTIDLQRSENMVYVKSKTAAAIQSGKVLRQKLMNLFQDNTVSESIRTSNLLGFPQVVSGNVNQNQSASNRFRDIFAQLSQAAVFLDYNRRIPNEDLKATLNILIRDNLSIMCEIQLLLEKFGLSPPDPANRSIMGNLPKRRSTFKTNSFCLNTMFKYVVLLNSHLTWYDLISTTAN